MSRANHDCVHRVACKQTTRGTRARTFPKVGYKTRADGAPLTISVSRTFRTARNCSRYYEFRRMTRRLHFIFSRKYVSSVRIERNDNNPSRYKAFLRAQTHDGGAASRTFRRANSFRTCTQVRTNRNINHSEHVRSANRGQAVDLFRDLPTRNNNVRRVAFFHYKTVVGARRARAVDQCKHDTYIVQYIFIYL